MLPGAVAVLATLMAWVPAQSPSPVDVVPVLTSTPFAAGPGQRVTHTVALTGTGTGTVHGVGVRFTTTVGLDDVTASPSRGTCPVVTALTVECDLGDLSLPDSGTTVTVTGTVRPGTAPGTLVQNLVTVTSSPADADPGNNAASNAYLVSGPATVTPSPTARAAGPPPTRTADAAPVVAGALGVAIVAAGAVLLWRRRRRA